jgi:hypothetical protein
MWGVYDAYTVYGFMEESYDQMIDSDWLEEQFPGIQIFASGIQKGCMIHAFYGVHARCNRKTGQLSVGNKNKQLVEDLYKYVKQHGNGDLYGEIEFSVALDGEYDENEKRKYVPAEDDDDEDHNDNDNDNDDDNDNDGDD